MIIKKKRYQFRMAHYALLLGLYHASFPAAYAHYYLEGSIAASFADLSYRAPSITYLSGGFIQDIYHLNDKQSTAPVLSVNAGYQMLSDKHPYWVEIGVGAYTNAAPYSYKGVVSESVSNINLDPLFNFAFDVYSTRLLIESKMAWQTQYCTPYFQFGAGAAWNTASNYHESAARSDVYTSLNPFHKNTKTQFSFLVGAGVSKGINLSTHYHDKDIHDQINLGYRYVDMGQTNFGTRGNAYPYALPLGRLSSNELYMSLSHLF